MQRVLAELGLADEVLLWNVVPTHPGTETSNRRPTRGGDRSGPLFRGRARARPPDDRRRPRRTGRARGQRVRSAPVARRRRRVREVAPCCNRRVTSTIRRNALLLASGLVFQSGMIQLAVALGTVTIVAVTGVSSILGLGPAVFLVVGALAVGPAGRLSDRVGRMPVIRGGFMLGIAGPLVTAAGCATSSGTLVFVGLGLCGAAQSIVLLSRAAAAEMFPPERRARGMSIVLFGVVSGAIWGPLVFGPMFSGRQLTAHDLVVPWIAAGLFTAAGLVVSFGVRPDPKELSTVYDTARARQGRRPRRCGRSCTGPVSRPRWWARSGASRSWPA